ALEPELAREPHAARPHQRLAQVEVEVALAPAREHDAVAAEGQREDQLEELPAARVRGKGCAHADRFTACAGRARTRRSACGAARSYPRPTRAPSPRGAGARPRTPPRAHSRRAPASPR